MDLPIQVPNAEEAKEKVPKPKKALTQQSPDKADEPAKTPVDAYYRQYLAGKTLPSTYSVFITLLPSGTAILSLHDPAANLIGAYFMDENAQKDLKEAVDWLVMQKAKAKATK